MDDTTPERKDTLLRTLQCGTARIAAATLAPVTPTAGAPLGTVALAGPAVADPMKHWSVPITNR